MDRAFLIKLAFKNLMLHKLRSLLTLSGVVIGISAIVFLVAFAFGLERLVTEQVTQGNAFKLIDIGTGNSQIVRLDDESVNKIRQISNIKTVEYIVNAGAKAKNGGKTADAGLYGTSDNYMEWSGQKTRWGDGLKTTGSGKQQIIINSAYIALLGAGDDGSYIGKEIVLDVLITRESTADNKSKVLADQKFVISGIIKDTNSPSAYVSSRYLQQNGAVRYSQAKAELNDQSQVDQTRRQAENMGFKTSYVGDTVNQITQVFNIFKIILGGFGLIALVVASLGMFNTLTISLLERMKEISLMKMLGMRRKDVRDLFITEAVIIGFIGGSTGVFIGFILAKIINAALNHYALSAGGDPVSVFYLPVWFIIAMLLFSFGVGILTGIYPSFRASRVNPLDVVRFE